MSCLNSIRYVLCIVRGFDKTFNMRLTDSGGAAIDLSNSSVILDCKNDLLDRTAEITNAVGGEFKFVFDSEDTSAFNLGTVHGTIVQVTGSDTVPRLRVSVKTEGL